MFKVSRKTVLESSKTEQSKLPFPIRNAILLKWVNSNIRVVSAKSIIKRGTGTNNSWWITKLSVKYDDKKIKPVDFDYSKVLNPKPFHSNAKLYENDFIGKPNQLISYLISEPITSTSMWNMWICGKIA